MEDSKTPDYVQCTVCDPSKEGDGLKSYTAYKVLSKTNMSHYGGLEFSVKRRYSDFLWLRTQLDIEFPGAIIPALPEKAMIGRFASTFVQVRMRGLQRFMMRTSEHPLLRMSEHFKMFITASQSEFAAYKSRVKATQKKSAGKQVKHFFSWMGGKFTGSRAGVSKTAEDLSFEEIHRYITTLEPIAAALVKEAEALTTKHKHLTDVLSKVSTAFLSMGSAEEATDPLGNTFTRVGQAARAASKHSTFQGLSEDTVLLELMQDTVRQVHACVEALGHRDNLHNAYHSHLHEVESKKTSVMKLTGVAGKESAKQKAEQEAAQAQDRADAAKVEHDRVARRVLTEVDRIKDQKLREYRNMVLDFVNLQILYNEKMEKIWQMLANGLGIEVKDVVQVVRERSSDVSPDDQPVSSPADSNHGYPDLSTLDPQSPEGHEEHGGGGGGGGNSGNAGEGSAGGAEEGDLLGTEVPLDNE